MSILIKVVSAQLSRDTEFFSNMDPYCILKLGSQSQRTRTKDEAGKKPVWNESFRFNSQENALRVTVMDEDGVSDDTVGSGDVDLSKFRNSSVQRQEIVQLYYQGKAAGKVLLKISGSGTQPNNNNTFGQGNIQQNTWGNQQQQPGNQWGSNQQNNQWGGNQPQPNQQQWGNTQPQNNQWGMQQNNSFGSQPQVNPYGNQNNGWGAQQGSSWNQPVNPNIAQNVVPNPNQWGQNSNQQNQWGNPNTVNPNTPPVNPNTPVNPNNPYPDLQFNKAPMGGNNAVNPVNPVNPLLLMGQTLQANGGFGGMNFNQPNTPPNQPPYSPPPNQYNNSYNNSNPNNLNMPYQLIGGMQGLIKPNNQPNTNPYSM